MIYASVLTINHTYMKTCYAYIRVSTLRQGEEGVSLQEQRRAILEYASKRNITVTEWFEEQVSAAKRGRPVFNRMVSLLKAKKVSGLIIHKIDRGSRNLRDWADMAELMDRGIDVHFVHESIDLHTRSGRLSADILAVVAADYIRNLREEVVKGINGRLKQGLFPFCAPVGYLNNGKGGKVKTIDPIRGPLVKAAFELYATRLYPLSKLQTELYDRGLRTRTGKKTSITQISTLLRNPFYMGLIRLKNRKDMFPGAHEPLIASSLYNQVQIILDGKRTKLRHQNRYLLRLMIKCEHCRLNVNGESHKGHTYYRCHRRTCPITCIREERFEAAIMAFLKKINIAPEEEPILAEILRDLKNREDEISQGLLRFAEEELRHIQESLSIILQKFLDNAITQETFNDGHSSLLMQRKTCEEKLEILRSTEGVHAQMQHLIADLRSVCQVFGTGTQEHRRKLLDHVLVSITTSGCIINLAPNPLMQQIAAREKTSKGWNLIVPDIVKQLAGRISSIF